MCQQNVLLEHFDKPLIETVINLKPTLYHMCHYNVDNIKKIF